MKSLKIQGFIVSDKKIKKKNNSNLAKSPTFYNPILQPVCLIQGPGLKLKPAVSVVSLLVAESAIHLLSK